MMVSIINITLQRMETTLLLTPLLPTHTHNTQKMVVDEEERGGGEG